MTSRGLFFKIMESSFQSHRGKYPTCFSTVELLVTSQLNLCKKTSHCLFLNSRPVGLWPLWRAMNEGRKKVKQREKQRGKNTYIQRQSDHFPQTIASTDWTGDKRLERESTLQQSQVIASLWCCSHMELAVWQRGYFRHMVRWWLFSGLSWFGLAIGIITRCCHILTGHRPTIGGHCRVGAYPCRQGSD